MAMRYGVGPGRSRPPAERASPRVIYGYIRPHRLTLLAGGLLSLATSATGLILPLVVRALIDDVSRHRGLAHLVVIMCLLMLADAVLGAAGGYLLLRTADSIVLKTRTRLIGRLLRITIGALDSSEPGDLMARVTVDTTLLRAVVSNAVVSAVTGTLTASAALVFMGLLDVELFGVTVGVVVCVAVMQTVIMPRIGRATRDTQEAVGEMSAALERMFGAFRTVKASGAEGREGARLHESAAKAWRAGLRADLWQAVVGNTTTLAVQFAFLAVLATGAAQVASGTISVGTMVAFLMYIMALMGPVNQVVNAATQYQVGAAAITRVEEAGRLPAEPAQQAGPFVRIDGPASVEFDDVRFRYRPTPRGAARGQLRHPARRHDGPRRAVRRGQDHGVLAHRAILRSGLRCGSRGRHRHQGVAAQRTARGDRVRRARRAGAVRHTAREPGVRRRRGDR